jgi:hypothetical protein
MLRMGSSPAEQSTDLMDFGLLPGARTNNTHQQYSSTVLSELSHAASSSIPI